MNMENRLLVTDQPVEVQDYRKLTDQFRENYGIYFKLIKKNRKIATWNWLDLVNTRFWIDHAQKSPQTLV